MLKVAPSTQFQHLGAPLRNVRWSWGAKRADGTIFLRAWDDEIELINGKRHIRLTNQAEYRDASHPGFKERCKHIADIHEGAIAYIILCKAVAPTPRSRKIKGIWPNLTRIDGIIDHQGDQWAELGEEVPETLVK